MNRNFVDDNVDLVLNAPSLTNCTNMFKGSNIPRITSLDLTTNCILDSMFEGCKGLQADCLIPMTTASCKRMFYNCSNIVTTSNNYERYYGHYFETQAMYYGVGARSYTYPNEMLNETSKDITNFSSKFTVTKYGTYTISAGKCPGCNYSHDFDIGYGPVSEFDGTTYKQYSSGALAPHGSLYISEMSSFNGYYFSKADNSYSGETNKYASKNSKCKGLTYSEIKISGKQGISLPSTSSVSTSTSITIPYIINCGETTQNGLSNIKNYTQLANQETINKTSGVTSINSICSNTNKFTTVDFNNYKKLTNAQSAFYQNTTITTVNMPDTYNLENGNSMFKGCTNLTTLNIPSLKKLQDGSYMFYNCRKLSFDTIPVTEGFPELTNAQMMFQTCTSLTTVDLKNTNKLVDASDMFNGCSALTEVKNLNNCTALENFSNALFGTSITSIDLSGLSALKNMQSAFTNCTKLTTVTGLNNLANCTLISSAFKGCTALTNLNNGQELLLPKVTNANDMFNGCTALRQVNLNLPSITNLSSNANGIFTGCTLTKITITATNCTSASNVFSGMSSLQTLYFNPGVNCTTYDNTLKGCTKLTYLKINVEGYNSEGQIKEVSTATSSEKCLLYDCTELTDLYFYGEIKHRMNFSKNEKLSPDSWRRIINALHDYSGESGGTTHVIIMSEEKYRSLTPEGFKQFGDKGWTVTRP